MLNNPEVIAAINAFTVPVNPISPDMTLPDKPIFEPAQQYLESYPFGRTNFAWYMIADPHAQSILGCDQEVLGRLTAGKEPFDIPHFFTVLEGEVALRLPGRGGLSIVIDQLTRKAMFGACVCFNRDSYGLTAQCIEDSVLLKTDNAVLKKLMDDDLMLGYRLQARISEIYFNRYNETMKKLQSIVMNIPLEAD